MSIITTSARFSLLRHARLCSHFYQATLQLLDQHPQVLEVHHNLFSLRIYEGQFDLSCHFILQTEGFSQVML
jgi:hypothetical protein